MFAFGGVGWRTIHSATEVVQLPRLHRRCNNAPGNTIGHEMTEQTIRLFISSPGDVATERRRATLAADKLNGEFAGRIRIEPVLWEERFYSSHASFQDQIAQAAACDIVVAIDRKSTRLNSSHRH